LSIKYYFKFDIKHLILRTDSATHLGILLKIFTLSKILELVILHEHSTGINYI